MALFTCDSEQTCGFGVVNLVPERSDQWGGQQRHLSARLSRPTGDVYVSLHIRDGLQLYVVEPKPVLGGLVTVNAAALGKREQLV